MSTKTNDIDSKIIIKEKDLASEELEKHILQLVSDSMANFNFETTSEIDIAKSIKVNLDEYNKRKTSVATGVLLLVETLDHSCLTRKDFLFI